MDRKKFFSNWIVRNILLAIAFVIGVVLLVSLLLSIITKHNNEIVVPDFTNMTYPEASASARSAGVKVYVSDSVFIRQMRRGGVYTQNPKPGSMVKKGRRIMLTTNSRQPKKIPMPSLVGFSLNQAKGEILSKGLTLDKLVYVKDLATNNVLKQQYKGVDVEPGARIEVGSPITLVLGRSSNGNTQIPNLVGQKYSRAIDAIYDHSLNVGKLEFDASVRNYCDTLNAVVIKQDPVNSRKSYLMGTSVSLKFSVNPKKINKALGKAEEE